MYLAPEPVLHAKHNFENGLAIVLLMLVWLAPNHQPPWGSFHHELLMAVALIAVSGVLAWQTRWQMPISIFSVIVLLAASIPWFQWVAGIIPKSGTALVSSSYVGALALAICIGHAAAKQSAQRFFFILFSALALAAFLNVPIQIIQWYQWYEHRVDSLLMLLVTPINASQRPSGMILQPNQLATIQVWGLIGLTWLRYKGSITLPFFIGGFGLISIGVGLTQSRAGLLEMLIVCSLLIFALRTSRTRNLIATWVVAIVLLVVWSLNFVMIAEWLGVRSTAVARLSAIDGARIDAWHAFLAAIVERPWTGYGIADVGYAYVSNALERPEIYIGQRFAHAHNALLDLMLWVGLPLGILISLAFLYWLIRRFLMIPMEPENVFPLAVVVALGIHAMLELPHHFLYFVVPAGFCIGWLCNLKDGPPIWSLPRWNWGIAAALVAAVITPIALDYFPYQERYTEWRFENQRVGKRPDIEVHKPLVLNQIHDELTLYRFPLRVDMPTEELKWIDDTARSVNSPHAYFAAGKAYALAGHREEAYLWMMRFNAIMHEQGIQQMKAIWLKEQARYPEISDLPWPDYQGRRSTFVMSPQDASPNLLPQDTFDPPSSRESQVIQ
ncbi:MAG: Wzy polymerase domain-containing protein [Hydrogenophaga sp.]|uniref:PglL family O-oligosaccharyltransferase n=1 Tax=Hydrogenophaga sp. TaxID=1904254 RepID=UPI0027376643|nr:O-antigen ligase family protein [Hydrogenophaga sp.]MDP3204979.1 Wzy polymerase domain-containing protein [Hydrogenophaga sp.]MDP3625704.1 Wzy polymerase domain-containing protein [Hydrogenophaga sp.]